MTTTVEALAASERQVLTGLADGRTLAAVASDLAIREGTARGYLRLAKQKLGVSETPAALAVGYATRALSRPDLEPEGLCVPVEQGDLLPFIAQGMSATRMATELKRPLSVVRNDARLLLKTTQARNPAHLITRAWQLGLLTEAQVRAWLR